MSEDIVATSPLHRVAESASLRRPRQAERLRDPRDAYRLGSALARRATKGEPALAADAEEHLWAALDAGIEDAARDLAVLLMLNDGRVREGIDLLVRARAYGVAGAEEILRMLTEEDKTHATA